MSTHLAQESSDFTVLEREPPELLARNLRVGSTLWSSATVFFFVDFLFAFFYLRSLNNAGLWRPKGVTPPVGYGTAVLVLVLATFGLSWLAIRERRAAGAERPLDEARLARWRLYGAVSVVLGVAAVVLQCVSWAEMGFGPASGGYASVYVGWTGLFALFLLGAMYWLETLVAPSFRYRGKGGVIPAGEGSGDPYRTAHDVEDPLALVLPGLDAYFVFAAVLAGVAVLAYVLLYLVQ
jgi:heme/copper-type cytochrome/quinol oxidase subunit 3